MTIALLTKGKVFKRTASTSYINIDTIAVSAAIDDPVSVSVEVDCL